MLQCRTWRQRFIVCNSGRCLQESIKLWARSNSRQSAIAIESEVRLQFVSAYFTTEAILLGILYEHDDLIIAIHDMFSQYGYYSEKDIHEIVTILEDLGIRSIKGLAVLDRKDFEEKQMKPAVINILMKKSQEMKTEADSSKNTGNNR
ncbi:uncharacterized protein LOC119431241 [Dermacentor silvarum]|uniref:uncharacterized protein LOC119431241 n=1 Tax=Dermacentor silvarum TaxID=543639 RepID=UPI002100E68D|nr:uncharacterized protein LOC119431241 [Dermacentor silvarum]